MFPSNTESVGAVGSTPEETTQQPVEQLPDRERVEAGEDRPSWNVERSIEDIESIDVGDAITFTKTIDEADVERFAAISGDTNPLHLDGDSASETRFEGRIAHGILTAGLISAALGRLPGTCVYLSQDLEFRAPVELGDRVTATVEIVEAVGDGRYRLRTIVENADEVAVDGEALVLNEHH